MKRDYDRGFKKGCPMNGKIAVGSVLICTAVCVMALQHGGVASQPAGPALKVGVVSMTEVFNNSKKHAQYKGIAMSRQARGGTQVEDLRKEVEGAEAELETFKQGTADYSQAAMDDRGQEVA